ncbi:MAG: methyltransferase domain-containing protein [Desulfobacterales bacterium]|jgi:SAM-dependent methyltransferase|nr:methyltransferase domain-containing protein [Desulfobacterales bacterium]
MKTVVFESDIIEQEVKPHNKLNIFRELLSKEVQEKIAKPEKLEACHCPACTSNRSEAAFEKFHLIYLQCRRCKSLYVSPRPSDVVLIDFYRYSKAWGFWREQILPDTREFRRKKIFYPRARWLLDLFDEYRPDAKLGVVVGYHSDLLIEALLNLEPDLFQLIVANPIADLELAHGDRRRVIVEPVSSYAVEGIESVDVVIAFDLLDRCSDIDLFFNSACRSLKPGGLLITSTILTGFDVLVLWDRSENIYPPDRINLFSTEGLTYITERYGFELLELSTPGRFDTESVHRAVRSSPEYEWPRFIRYLFENRDETAFGEFQEYLQKFRLSSFGRLVLRKPDY